jgi:nucleotide-binding universal stress UspA family protein
MAVVALIALAGAPSADARGGPTREFFGVVPQTAITPAELDRMAANGVGSVRVNFSMPQIEPGLSEYNWGPTDELVREAAARGIRLIPTVFGTPSWLQVSYGEANCGGICAPDSEGARNAWAEFAAALVARYGPRGSFWAPTQELPTQECQIPLLCRRGPPPCGCTTALPIHTWQIWNEQNSPKYFAPAPNPQRYGRLLVAASARIHAVDPTAEVITGGMWGPPSADEVIPTAQYLRRLYAVPGVKGSFDAVSVHPYASSLDGVDEQVKAVLRVIRAAGDDAGIWVTELGWASGGPRENGLVKTPKGQARLLTSSITTLVAKRLAWRIRGVLWYAWRDAPPEATDCEWCPKSGLRAQSGAGKPAAKAFRRLVLGLRR